MMPVQMDIYYASTCAPCRLELPAVAEAIRDGLPVSIVVVTAPDRARRDLEAVAPDLAARAILPPSPPADPRAALRAGGDPDGILPFARVRHADGSPCRTWRGALSLERIRRLLASCAGR